MRITQGSERDTPRTRSTRRSGPASGSGSAWASWNPFMACQRGGAYQRYGKGIIRRM
jgi:hypothetical protein